LKRCRHKSKPQQIARQMQRGKMDQLFQPATLGRIDPPCRIDNIAAMDKAMPDQFRHITFQIVQELIERFPLVMHSLIAEIAPRPVQRKTGSP